MRVKLMVDTRQSVLLFKTKFMNNFFGNIIMLIIFL